MDSGNKENLLKIIKTIEQKNSEMDEYVSNLSILSRNEMLKKITHEIINNNSLLQELIGTENQITPNEEIEKSSDFIIETYINKIQKDPHKKVIFLREFLELFQERISEKDKDIILKSLKDEKNDEKLRDEMISLANVFKLTL
jgi:hypothetical protein